MSLRLLFIVQGEGLGHMTQAVALADIMRSAGHEVVAAHVGTAVGDEVPEFFKRQIAAPILVHRSPVIRLDADRREIDPVRTLGAFARMAPSFVRSLQAIEESLERYKPDIVVNFYEPLTGLMRWRSIDMPPVVCIAHQYMFLHDRYPFDAGSVWQRRALMLFTRMTTIGARKLLAMSLYDAPDIPARKLRVVPPLLRPELFEKRATTADPPFFLVYLWRSSLCPEIREFNRRNPGIQLHCFMNHPGAVSEENVSETLTLHHLDDGLFLDMLAACSGVATTAGFETPAEAMYLGKPLLLVPTHMEQKCNARDVVRAGGAIAAEKFELHRLRNSESVDPSGFREWVDVAPDMFVSEIEHAASGY